MRALRSVTGVVAVLDRADVDTDQIIPKQFLKRIERSGFGQFLFYDWMRDPAFELHAFPGASILLAGPNFACGSSREHAAWALEDFGFSVVLAPSFGDIFRRNAVLSGLAPVELRAADLAAIREALQERNELTVDLEELRVTHANGLSVAFELDPGAQETLVNGLDDVTRTLERSDAIEQYERRHPARYDARTLAI